jgi:RNA polymerase sigma factor (TIGR02999 family)
MSDLTSILSAVENGDPQAAEQLLPIVYEELRELAAQKMAQEAPGQTLQATALVHEAYLRLVDGKQARPWEGRRHFFFAAAEAMRRILIDKARQKRRFKRGGDLRQQCLEDVEVVCGIPQNELIALYESLQKLAGEDPAMAQIVQLRFFAGLSHEEAASLLGVSAVTAKRHWRYARAWLHRELHGADTPPA